MESSTTTQQTMMHAEPQKEHRWLQKFLGEWTYEGEAPMTPGEPPTKFTGTESARSIGGLWLLAEGKGVTGDSEDTAILTLGYAPEKKRFLGSWVGSMMTYLWVYDGELNAEETTLTLFAEGPDMEAPGKMVKYKDVHEFKSDDHRVLTSHMLGADGSWQQFMEMHYHKKR